MKRLFLAATIVAGLLSCSPDVRTDSEELETSLQQQFPQRWKLKQMSGNITGLPPATGSKMDWQEDYLLNSDKTFVKSRQRNGVVSEQSGSYTFFTTTDGTYLELVYNKSNNLIGNCTAEPKEILFFTSTNELTSTWAACDGPGLLYERLE